MFSVITLTSKFSHKSVTVLSTRLIAASDSSSKSWDHMLCGCMNHNHRTMFSAPVWVGCQIACSAGCNKHGWPPYSPSLGIVLSVCLANATHHWNTPCNMNLLQYPCIFYAQHTPSHMDCEICKLHKTTVQEHLPTGDVQLWIFSHV